MSFDNYLFIDSVKHDVLKEVRKYKQKKHRNHDNIILLDGEKELVWALEYGAKISIVLLTSNSQFSTAALESARGGAKVFLLKSTIFERYFSSTGSNAVAALAHVEPAQVGAQKKLGLFFEDVIDPGNIGTMIRTARSFGISDFFANDCEIDWFAKKSVRASRGSHFLAKFHSFTDTKSGLETLKKNGWQIVGTSPHATELVSMSTILAKPTILMMGNEQEGLSKTAEDLADVLVRIPMMSEVESLNVAIASGISIYELYYRLVLSMLSENIRSNLGRNIGVLFQLFPKVLNQDLAKASKLSANLVIFLMMIKMDGKMTKSHAITDLARLGEDQKSLDVLLKNKLVEEVDANTIRITKDGETTLAKLWMIIENAEHKIVSVLSELEQSELRSILSRLEQKCYDLLNDDADSKK